MSANVARVSFAARTLKEYPDPAQIPTEIITDIFQRLSSTIKCDLEEEDAHADEPALGIYSTHVFWCNVHDC